MFTEDQKEKLEECGRRLISPEMVADYLGLDRKAVIICLEGENEYSKLYRKGVASTVFDVQSSEIDFAKLGAPNAVKNIISYLNKIH